MMRHGYHHLVHSLAALLFMPNAVIGTLLLMMMAIVPNVLIGALAAWLAVMAMHVLIGHLHPTQPASEPLLNAILCGMGVGYVLAPAWESMLAAGVAGLMGWTIATAMGNSMRTLLHLPPLSLPFVLASVITHLALQHAPALAPGMVSLAWLPTVNLYAPLLGLFTGLGALIFLPHPLVGAIIIGMIAWRSRILLLLAFGGHLAGASFRAFTTGSWEYGWQAPDSFNSVLTAMAIGGVFLIPSWRSFILAFLSAALTAGIGEALLSAPWWGGAGIPVYTLPFVIVTLIILSALGALASPLLASHVGLTPEATLLEHWSWRLRFPGSLRALHVPFTNQWTVWQGVDGRWTHQGLQRHALDFVICDAGGETHQKPATTLNDFYCYGQAILTPIRGQVITVVDGLPDNAPGCVDQMNPWGNYVVLYDTRGFYVTVAHLVSGSVTVTPGQQVEIGTLIGQCGNSGYSPQPHLHLQVQTAAFPSSQTLPFSLRSWTDGIQCHTNDTPIQGKRVSNLLIDNDLVTATCLILDQELAFIVLRKNHIVDTIRWRVGMSNDGGLFLASTQGRLSFGIHEGTFYCYRLDGNDPWLRLFALAAARFPLSQMHDSHWHDLLPIPTLGRRGLNMVSMILGLIRPQWAMVLLRSHKLSRWISRTEVGVIGDRNLLSLRLTIDPNHGFWRVEAGDFIMQRITTPMAEVKNVAA